ncbi:cytochrome P450 [Streptomyces jumonjinensis]|uniref:cytochrome P450 n=1 Tax=Streptomyces jumonjinensis TaxID=1945 RepID=UPI0037A34976
MSTTGTGTPVKLESDGGRCLYDQVDALRAAGPAVRIQLPEGVIAWSVSRGDVVKRLLTHPGVSRDARKSVPDYRPGEVLWLATWVDLESMFTAEGSDHIRLRKLIGPAFTPRRTAAMRPAIERIVAARLDALEKLPGDAPVDLRDGFCYPVPTRVICDLFGVPDAQRDAMLKVFDLVTPTDVTREESAALGEGLTRVVMELIEAKRREPGDDLTSLLLTAHEDDGDRLTEYELVSTLSLMIGAGGQTTIALLGHAVRELLGSPAQLAAVLADPARWGDVVEETLRLHPSVMHLPLHWAKEDIDLGEGVVIRAHDAILMAFGAHGRDPAVHDAPRIFDVDRADKTHLAFGYGAHFCLGAQLARLEAEVALPALFSRFPGLALAADPERLTPKRSFIGNDMQALPVWLNHGGTTAGRGTAHR